MIGGIRYTGAVAGRAGASPRRGPGFHLPGAAEPAPAAVAGTAALAFVAERTPEERDDAARRRGHALLEEMEGLRRDLLRGRMDSSRLSRLSLLAEGEAGHDPALRDALEGIALRARVELARYSMTGKAKLP